VADAFDLPNLDAFTAGTVGRPGERTFFVQVRAGGHVVTVKCEKQQVEALGAYLARMLEDLPVASERPAPDALELVEPILPAFVLGSIGVAFDEEADRIVLHFEELVVSDADDEDDPTDDSVERSRLHVRVTRGQARAFCERAGDAVAGGRPACRFCGLPIDADGHYCPRMN
jgi:uncharacterized repeat protein (TIGR03847 family)